MPAMAPAERPVEVLLVALLFEEGSEELEAEGSNIGTRC